MLVMIQQLKQRGTSINWAGFKDQLAKDVLKVTTVALPVLDKTLGYLTKGLYYYTAAFGTLIIPTLILSPLMPQLFLNSVANTARGYIASQIANQTRIQLLRLDTRG